MIWLWLKALPVRLLGVLALAVLALMVLGGLHRAGRQAERMRRQESLINAIGVKADVAKKVDGMQPDAALERLRGKWSRD